MAKSKGKEAKSPDPREGEEKRAYVSQADVPSSSLEQALRVAKALGDHFAYKAASPLRLAGAIGMQPDSGSFRLLCGASIAYGLTQGGYNAVEISLTELGRRIVRPLQEGDDLTARREAVLRPRIIKEFLEKYDRAKMPREDIARNVLLDMGVPGERTSKTYELVVESAKSVGFVQTINGVLYVELNGIGRAERVGDAVEPTSEGDEADQDPRSQSGSIVATAPSIHVVPTQHKPGMEPATDQTGRKKRVFITHGKNRGFLDPIKRLLGFGELEPIVSAERESVSVPVPDKVMSDMRGCGAAIIHVEDELKLMDASAQEHVVLNPNVLIEIGAAMALYGRRFILLVKNGVKLPSNLQGLYEVRYSGETLDGDATIKLMEAIRDIKNHPLP
jgi:predicted nucleotide-binding protein